MAMEIVEKTGKSPSAIGNLLSRMKADGHIENPGHGQWRAKGKFTNSHSYRECEYVNFNETAETTTLTTAATQNNQAEPEIW